MHEAALKAAGLEGEYREYPVRPEELEDWLHTRPRSLRGFNVTMPHKEKVWSWVVTEGELGPRTHLGIRAVNTVVMKDARPIGENTDTEGFLGPLREAVGSHDFSGWQVVLLGAGGAAEAIVYALASQTKAARLTIWNRHADRAKSLVKRVNGVRAGFAEFAEDLGSLPVRGCRLLIHATPMGMREGEGLLIDPSALKPGQIVYDIVYEPRETALIRAARERGCQTITGDEMLAAQGAASFEIWTGVKGMYPVMRKALEEHFEHAR